MKKIVLLLSVVLTLALVVPVAYAQNLSKSEQKILKKMEKEARKDAKAYKKEGWKVAPGKMPIETQLLEARKLSLQQDDYGFPLYVEGTAVATGTQYDGALFKATSVVRTRIAERLESIIVETITVKQENKEISKDEATSLVEAVGIAKQLVSQKLGRVIIPLEMYRELKDGRIEVSIIGFYNQELAYETFVQAMHDNLLEEADELSGRIEDIFKRR